MHLHDRGRHPPHSRPVALDAQPLAYTTARGMSLRQGRYALAVLAMATAAFGAPLDLSLDAYRVAAADGATGTVAGRAVDEADRRNSQDEPRAGLGQTRGPATRKLR